MTQRGISEGCFVAGGRGSKLSLWMLIACWLVAVPTASSQDSESVLVSVRAQYTDAVALTPGQAEVERPFAVDGGDETIISISSNSHTVDVSLIDPSGSVHSADSTDSVVTSSSTLLLESDEGANISRTLFALSNPPVGIWRYRVGETAGFSDARAVLFTMTSSSDIVLGLLGAGRDFRMGRPIALNLLLAGEEGGIPPAFVTSLTAVVHRGGEPPTAIDFRDDGNGQDENANDGIYTAEFSVDQAGDYTVSARVEGAWDGRPFMRTAASRFRAIEGCASLTREFFVRSADLDDNGRPDFLELEFNVDVQQSATVGISSVIETPDGSSVSADNEAQLETGIQQIAVRYPVSRLRFLETDGPYEVSDVVLFCEEDGVLVQADQQFGLGSTGTFSLADAERRSIEPTGANSEQGVDSDGSGRFDRLDYSVGLDFLTSGTYDWGASLLDSQGRLIERVTGRRQFGTGPDSLIAQFDGLKIGRNAADGPYTVADFSVQGVGGVLLIASVGQTEAYRVTDFDGAPGLPGGGGPAPTINSGGVVDAAAFQPVLVPGGIGSLFGVGLADGVAHAAEIPLPSELRGARVRIDGRDAPLFFASANQINFQVPFDVRANETVQVVVIRNGVESPPVLARVADYAPGVFMNANTAEPIVQRHPDNALITADNPAQPGDVLIVFLTGIGDVSNPPPTGMPALASPLATANLTPTVTVGDVPAQVLFAGLAPFFVGLGQLNIQLPDQLTQTATLSTGSPKAATVPLVIAFGESRSQPVNLPIAGSGTTDPQPPPGPETPPDGTSVQVVPNPVDFGQVQVGQTAELSVSIRNGGTERITLSDATSDNPAFVVDGPFPSLTISIGPGTGIVIRVRFTPTTTGQASATLTVVSDDPVSPMLKVLMIGEGT